LNSGGGDGTGSFEKIKIRRVDTGKLTHDLEKKIHQAEMFFKNKTNIASRVSGVE